MNQKKKISILIIIALVLGAVIFLNQKQESSSPVTESNQQQPAEHDHDSHEHNDEQKPVATKPANSTPVELSVAMKQLPTIRDMEGLTDEDVHHTPDAVVEGGMLIGELLEEAEKNPAKREDTLKFFKSCAENADLMPAIRAVCWKRTLDQIPEWKIFLPISDADVPEDIKVLSSKIP